MSSMTRSRTQVLRGYLPGQTFQHANQAVVKTVFVENESTDVDPEILFENLAQRLKPWREYVSEDTDPNNPPPAPQNRAPGFPELPRFQDRYELREPIDEVRFAVWPLVLRCTNPKCEKAVSFQDAEAWKTGADRCDLCGFRREQMPYMQVHICGNDNVLAVPPCETHGYKHVYLKDEASFETSSWRCRAPGCNGRFISNMRYRACSCGMGGGYISRTVRQDDRFITHTLDFVSFEKGPRLKLTNTPGGEKVVIGYWLGLFDDYEQALVDAGNNTNADSAAKWPEMEKMMRGNPAFSEQDIENMRKTVVGETRGALAAVTELVPESVCNVVGTSQRARERTLIWAGAGGLRRWRLNDFRQAALDTGRHSAATVLDDAQDRLASAGFSDLLIVENFPVALAAYGYTRVGRTPGAAQLKPFPPRRRVQGKTPIYVVESKTEGLFFELDAVRVLDWLTQNGWHQPVALDQDPMKARVQAKAAVLTAVVSDPVVNDYVTLLEHTLAHALIRNLGERSGFAENTMAEYIFPELLTVGVYAATHQSFTLGALISLAEHRLGEWLEAAQEGAKHCDWDPQCGRDEGACMGCLHLSFGCAERNEHLDRAVLFGAPHGHVRTITNGFWA